MIEPSMTAWQSEIYNALLSLRPAIAAFYKDGLKIIELPLEAKSNLLGHLLREIDGGLRDIFKIERNSDEKIEHKQSIIESFGLDEKSSAANAYLRVSRQFHKYAHRSNKDIITPRESTKIIDLWHEFEHVLYPLLGSFIGSIARLEVLLERDKPNAVADGCLSFILGNDSRRIFFFQRLNKLGWLRPLYEQGVFEGKLNPELVETLEHPGYYSIPYWYELSYVTRIISQIEDGQNEFWQIITSILDGILKYRKEDGTSIQNPQTNDFIVHLISFLPNRYLRDDYLDTVKTMVCSNGTYGLNSFQRYLIPRFIQKADKKHLLMCLDIMFLFKDNGSNYPKYISPFDPYTFESDFKQWNDNICCICGVDGLRILLQKLAQVKDDPELIFITSVDETDYRNRYQDKYSAKLIFAVINYAQALSISELYGIVKELLLSNYYIHKQIAFLLIDKQYDQLKELFWEYPSNPMLDFFAETEIYHLLSNHVEKFLDNEISLIIDYIDSITIQNDTNATQIQIDYRKKIFATALKHRDNPMINDYINKINNAYPEEVSPPGYEGYTGINVYSGTDQTINLAKNNISEIIEMYNEVESPSLFSTYNLDADFSKIVSQQIVQYTEDIDILIDAPLSMVRAWVLGLLLYFKKKSVIVRVEKVFKLINQLLLKENFFEKVNEKTNQKNIEYSFLSELLSFINALDFSKLSYLDMEQISIILNTIYQKKLKEYNNDWDRHIDSIHNRCHFNLYNAMITLNDAYAKQKQLAEGERWNSELKDIIENSMNSDENDLDLFFAIGYHHHSFWYIDKIWMVENINKIFLSDNEKKQIAAIYGFLMNYPLADNNIFCTLIKEGKLINILSNDNESDFMIQTIIFNILEGVRAKIINENIIDSLIEINSKNIYTKIINYGCNLIKNESNTSFIIRMWEKIINRYSSNCTEPLTHFCKESYRWLEQIETLDDKVLSWLIISAQNSSNQNFYHFTKLLQPFIHTKTEKTGQIVLELIKNTGQIYRHELHLLVEKLYEKEITSLADEICNECAKKQDFSLNDIYKKHHL